MRITGESERVREILENNPDLSLDAGRDGRIVLVENDDGDIEVHVVIGERTTARAMRLALTLAERWRERICRYQGRWPEPRERLLEASYQRHRAGESTQAITRDLNEQLKAAIRGYVSRLHQFDKALREAGLCGLGENPDALSRFPLLDGPKGQHVAREMDELLDLAQQIDDLSQELQVRVEDWTDALYQGQHVFDAWEPIAPDWLREALRHWSVSRARNDYLKALCAKQRDETRRVQSRIQVRPAGHLSKEKLVSALCQEAGDQPIMAIVAQHIDLIDRAASGDQQALIALREVCGLPPLIPWVR